MDIKQNYDRVLLVVFGILALVLGVLLTMKALALPDKFARAEGSPKENYSDSGLDAVNTAIAHVDKDIAWVSPGMPGVPQKGLPLMKSVPVWVKAGVEIDLLDPESEKIRAPLDNAYIHQHGLPAGRSDLLEIDLDNDGFNTLEEFESGKTDPNSETSHPAFTNKLSLAEVKQDEYSLEFRTSGGAAGDNGIRETTTLFQGESPRRKTHFVRMNGAFGVHPGHEDQFKLTGFEKKQKAGRTPGTLVDADEVTIEDTKNPGNPLKLALREPHLTFTYYAVLHYALPGSEGNLEGFFKLGDTFELPNEPGTTYKIVELSGVPDDGVKIQKVVPAGETPKTLNIPPMQKNG